MSAESTQRSLPTARGVSLRDRLCRTGGLPVTRKGIALATTLPLVLAMLMAVQMRSFSPGLRAEKPIDHHKYVYMAENPLSLRTAPFCYRLLVPWVVSLLGLPTQIGFWIVSVAAMTLTSVMLYAAARATGLTDQYAVLSCVCFLAVGPAMRAAFAYYPTVDPAAWCLITIGMWAILRKHDLLLAGVILIGAFVKEPVFFLIALYYGWSAERVVDVRAALKVILLATGGVIAFLGLRMFLPALNNDSEYLLQMGESLTQVQLGTSRYEIMWLLEHIGSERLHQVMTLKFWYDMTLSVFGPLLLVCVWACVVCRDVRDMLLRSALFFLLCFLPIFVSRATVRMIVVAAPVLVLAEAWSLWRLAQHGRIRFGFIGLMPVIQLAAVAFLPPIEERVLSFVQTAGVSLVMATVLSAGLISGRSDRTLKCGQKQQ